MKFSELDHMRKRILVMCLVFVVGICLIIGIQIIRQHKKNAMIKNNSVQAENKTETIPMVIVKKLELQNYEDTIRGVTGKIDVARAKLAFEISGTIENIYVDKGDAIKKGDSLALLNAVELSLKVKYKENALDGAKIELEKAEKIYNENKEKAKTGYILESKLKEYELDVDLKQNKVQAAELEFESAKENATKTKLIAPFDGVVLEKKVELGESVSNNKEAFVLLDIANIYADIEINEKKLSKIEPGQKITLTTNIYKKKVTGHIKAVVPAVLGKAMVLTARAKLDKTDVMLLPGMFVLGDIEVFNQADAMVVLLKTLSKEADNYFVFIYDEKNSTVQQKQVVPYYMSDDSVVIKSGLIIGDMIVVDTTQKLKDGQKVRVNE